MERPANVSNSVSGGGGRLRVRTLAHTNRSSGFPHSDAHRQRTVRRHGPRCARFDVDGEQREAGAGNFVVVAADTPHRYENIGAGTLRVVSVHPSGVVMQTNL